MMSKTLGGGKFVYYTEKSLMLCNVRSCLVSLIGKFLLRVMLRKNVTRLVWKVSLI